MIAYTREEILAYLDFCRSEIDTQISAVDLEQASGFYWLPLEKLELQIYNIRHIQHHAGKLYERLGVTEQIHAKWVGVYPG